MEANHSVLQSRELRRFIQIKYSKIGFQVSELFDDDLLKEKLYVSLNRKTCCWSIFTINL